MYFRALLASALSKRTDRSTTYQASSSVIRYTAFILLSFTLLTVTGCSPTDTISPDGTRAVAAREAAAVLRVDDFEGTTFASFWHTELWTKTAGYVSSEQKRAGKQAMRFSWKPSQVNGTNMMLHSELTTGTLPVGETERWYGFSSYLPSSSMANDEQQAIITQWLGVADPGFSNTMPPLGMAVKANRLQLGYAASNKPITEFFQRPTSIKQMDLGPAIFDRWVDYVVHVKWDPSGNTGQLQVWRDGIVLVNEQNINIGYPQINKPYWKFGLYCWEGKSTYDEKVAYYDEIRIGDARAGYDAVKPGRNNGTASEQQILTQ